ncbi:hypothetical protein [Pseudocitrobacter faecalis]|uniref:hypothetical protein n=1 Tax=Pseudocitrobacter faecalis TaxID=1398493 RepID=UPI00142E16D0
MSIADTWTDDAFIRLMKDLISEDKENESREKHEREPVAKTDVYAASPLLPSQG